MDWDKLRAFAAAVETGSLTAAGERLGLSQSALSRKIAALEKDLGTPLFHRHARGLTPTGPARLLADAVGDVSSRLRDAELKIRDLGENPVGELTVTAPAALGSFWLTPRIERFLKAYPGIDVRLILDDREVDLDRLEADVALRPWPPGQADLIQRKLFDVPTHLYASREYLNRRGAPESVAALDDHDILTLAAAAPAWMRRADWAARIGRPAQEPRRAMLQISTFSGLVQAAIAGLGVASLPDYLIASHGDLVRVLPDEDGPRFEVRMVYPQELRGSKRVAAFSRFLSEERDKTL